MEDKYQELLIKYTKDIHDLTGKIIEIESYYSYRVDELKKKFDEDREEFETILHEGYKEAYEMICELREKIKEQETI